MVIGDWCTIFVIFGDSQHLLRQVSAFAVNISKLNNKSSNSTCIVIKMI